MVSVKSWPSLKCTSHCCAHVHLYAVSSERQPLSCRCGPRRESSSWKTAAERAEGNVSLAVVLCTAVVVLSICITPVWKYRMPCFSCMIGFVYFFVFFTVGPGEINSSCLMCLFFFPHRPAAHKCITCVVHTIN